jgi:urease accessory protein
MVRSATYLSAATLALFPTTVLAHTGVGETSGFVHGFLHPIGGLDHALAMVAVGLFAARLGGRALWLVPLAFVGVMAVGGALGMAGAEVALVEIGIAFSIVILGAVIALRLDLPVIAAMALVGFFAIFHGHAHGAEMPETTSGLTYGAGFILATALLHAVGISLCLLIGTAGQRLGHRIAQVAGGAMAITGFAILGGVL